MFLTHKLIIIWPVDNTCANKGEPIVKKSVGGSCVLTFQKKLKTSQDETLVSKKEQKLPNDNQKGGELWSEILQYWKHQCSPISQNCLSEDAGKCLKSICIKLNLWKYFVRISKAKKPTMLIICNNISKENIYIW